MLEKVDQYYQYKYTAALKKNAAVTKSYLEKYLALQEAGRGIPLDDIQLDTNSTSFIQNSKNLIKRFFPWMMRIKELFRTKKTQHAIKQGAKAKL